MTVDPGSTEVQNIYKLLIGVIVPRPIAWVSSISADGVPNLAPFSFFTAASANPPMVCFCPMVRGNGTTKDTVNNIRETAEFVVNIVSEELAAQMNVTSGEYPPDVDEFEKAGLTRLKSDLVKPTRVAKAKVNMECRLVEIVDVSAKPLGGSIVIGEVLRFHVHDDLFDNFRVDADKLAAVGRMAGASYARTQDRFDLERPKV